MLLEHCLKTLRLPTMRREHAKLATVCQADRADYATCLLRLAEREVQDREVRAARFPVLKTLDIFDLAAQPSINQALVRELIRVEPRARKTPPQQLPVAQQTPTRVQGDHPQEQVQKCGLS